MKRSGLVGIIVVALLVLFPALPSPVLAAPKLRCTGLPFSFANIQTPQFDPEGSRVKGEWLARGATTVVCPNRVLSVDVWEHAYIVLAGHPVGMPALVTAEGTATLKGRTELGFMMSNGELINWGGQLRGAGPCASGICVIDVQVQASTRGGAKLQMLQRVTIDLTSRTITNMDVLNIVIEFTSAG